MYSYQRPYYPIKLWADSLQILIIFSLLTLGTFFSSNQPFGIILGILIGGIGAKYFKKTIKNLSRNIKKQPAIELTEECFFDHINNTKIYWNNITKIQRVTLKTSTYVVFILRDKKSYSKQLDGFVSRLLFNLPDPDEISVKTELSLVKGRNEDIYDQIYKFHKRKISPTSNKLSN